MLVNVPVAFFRLLLPSLCFGDGECDTLSLLLLLSCPVVVVFVVVFADVNASHSLIQTDVLDVYK